MTQTLLASEILQILSSEYDIQLQKDPLLLPTIGMHPVWKLTAENNKYYALKCYSHNLRNLYAQELLPLEETERLAAYMVQQNVPTIAALPGKDKCELITETSSFFIYPWVEGEHTFDQQISKDRAYKVGQLLAVIHCAGQDVHSAAILPIMASNMETYLDEFRLIYPNSISDIEYNDLKTWYELSLNSNRTINQVVFSHRDLMPSNILWLKGGQYFLLDWEFCGQVQADFDVFITALNWSYVTSGNVDIDLFQAAIRGYLSNSAINFDFAVLLNEYCASVLHWVQFNLRRALHFPKQFEAALTEIKKTYQALTYVNSNAKALFKACNL